jgi:uncharacterized protein YeaO (DUF488 family)
MDVRIKRVYETPQPSDGTRILIDRLWPRGLTKDRARVDLWLKDIAPSTSLREWFGHDPAKWEEFQRRYQAELDANPATEAELRAALQRGPATLVYGAKDEQHNDAVVLKAYLET